MFEKATRNKLRFVTIKGVLSVEDLWDLPLTSSTGKANLDDIAKALDAECKKSGATSFVTKAQKVDDDAKLAFDIVLHIINVRVAENEARSLMDANRAKKQKIMEIIDRKQDQALESASIDDLRAMVDSL